MKRAKRKPAKSSGKTPASEDEVFILQFRFWLKDVNPMVWRRVQVASTMTLREFHGVLQGVGSGWGRNDTLSVRLRGPEIFAGQ